MTQYEDKEIGAKHGDVFVSLSNGAAFCFRFRCGPAPRYCWMGNWWYAARHARPKRAWGQYRYPKTLRSLRWAEAHKLEGIKVRTRGNCDLPTVWDDNYCHAEKNWKRHRRTQYR